MTAKMQSEKTSSICNATAVAIDKGKNSLQAFRWAIDNLTGSNPVVVLLHVRPKIIQSHADRNDEPDIQLLFHPLRPYCARKRVQLAEVVLEDADVSKALIEYINRNSIRNIVLGSSPRIAFARKFWQQDIPTIVMKSAPSFCSVYVTRKGKLFCSKIGPETAPTPNDSKREDDRSEPSTKISLEKNQYAKSESDFTLTTHKSTFNNHLTPEDYDIPIPSSSRSASSLPSEFSNPAVSALESMNHIPSDMETEMKRLRLELKQTMDMYNSACKEALSAKKKADEAQKLIEAETQKRKHAEQKAQKEALEKNRALIALANNDLRYRRYAIDEIENATNKFSDSMKVGEGGYGPVFKGKLDHTPVAIKLLRSNAAHGKRQFQQEVEVLSTMRHPNLVLLLGACPEYGCLVYEYMDYGSLEDRLLQRDETPPLSWRIRFKIAAEIATALLFLHQAKPEPLVHRDLKPANILLDRNYVSKISDVGLARLVPPSVPDSVTQYHLTSAAGTFCYIDPEYQQTGKLTTKSDLYSLGIMFLQMITSKPPIGIAHHVAKSIQTGTFEDLLDQSVPDWPVKDTLRFAKLALNCSELRKRDRPCLATEVIPELNRLRDLGSHCSVPLPLSMVSDSPTSRDTVSESALQEGS